MKSIGSIVFHNRNVTVVLFTTLIMGTVSSFSSWFLPIYLLRFGEGALFIVVVVYTFANLIVIPPVLIGGIISDVYGRKLLILTSTFLYAIGFTLLLLENVWAVTFSSVIIILAGALIFAPLSALLGESVSEDKVAFTFSLFRCLSAIGGSVGSLIIGYLSTYLGVKEVVIACVIATYLSLTLRSQLRETGLKHSNVKIKEQLLNSLKHVGSTFKLQRYIKVLALAIVVVSIGNGVFSLYFPLSLTSYAKLSDIEIGLIFAAADITSIVAFTFVGFFVDKLGWLKSITVALSTEAATIFALSITPNLISSKISLLVMVTCLYILLSIFSSLDQVSGDKMLISITHKETRGIMIASLGCLSLFPKAFSPILGSAILTAGYHATLISSSILYAAGSVLMLLLWRIMYGIEGGFRRFG